MELSRKDKQRILKTYTFICEPCNRATDVTRSIKFFESFAILCDKCGKRMKKEITAPALLGFNSLGQSGRNR